MNAGSEPIGIAAGADGNLWFTDPGTTKAVGRITPAGTITEFSTGLNTGSFPVGIAAGPDGNLWFTDGSRTTPAIGRVTPGGTITEFSTGLNPGSDPDRDRGGARRQPVVHRPEVDQGGRADHPGRDDHRILNRPD